MLSKLPLFVVTILIGLFIVSPAQADDSTARAHWHSYALQMLDKMQEQDSLPACPDGDFHAGCRLNNPFGNSYRARLEAWRSGSYNSPSVTPWLNKVLDSKITDSNNPYGGYGLTYPRDAYGDGTTNPSNTVYTVTDADHIGPTILAAAQAGAVDDSEVYFIIDSIMHQPIVDTGYGKCMAYSDQPSDSNYCTLNVTLGAAAFLKNAYDAGYSRPGQLQMVEDLKPFAEYAYENGGARPGFWPYGYEIGTGRWWGSGGKSQDWNHNSYTAEAARDLGMWQGYDSLRKMEDKPNYLKAIPRDVEGRLRAVSDLPDYKPTNMWQDMQWYASFDNGPVGSRAYTDYAQAALWASRLAENADASSIVAKKATVAKGPWVYLHKNGHDTLVTGPVPTGSTLIFRGIVREDQTNIIYKRVVFRYGNHNRIDAKRTGNVGNIAFVTKARNRCYQLAVPYEAVSKLKCIHTY